jgi:hypothetical protein
VKRKWKMDNNDSTPTNPQPASQTIFSLAMPPPTFYTVQTIPRCTERNYWRITRATLRTTPKRAGREKYPISSASLPLCLRFEGFNCGPIFNTKYRRPDCQIRQ